MTERLKEIKEDLPYSIRYSGELEPIIEYAKEQAERVQELEKRLKIYQKRSWFEDYEKVAKQNKCYREILNASRGIIKDAIYALDNNKKVQGLEFAVKIINRALEGEE